MDFSSTSFDRIFGSTSESDHDKSSLELEGCRLVMNYTDLTLDHSKWKTMMPPDKDELIWSSAYSLRFFLGKSTGKNCFLLGASTSGMRSGHGLEFIHGYSKSSTPGMRSGHGFEFIHGYSKSRFSEVVELADPRGVEIHCRIRTQVFTPKTSYAAYLVFDFIDNYEKPQKLISTVEIVCGTVSDYRHSKERQRIVKFKASNNRSSDGWMEIELGEFYVGEGYNGGDVVVHLVESSGYVIEGIEFRPLEEEKTWRGTGIFSNIKVFSAWC